MFGKHCNLLGIGQKNMIDDAVFQTSTGSIFQGFMCDVWPGVVMQQNGDFPINHC